MTAHAGAGVCSCRCTTEAGLYPLVMSSDATIFLAKASNARKISSKCSNARNARFASLAFLANLAKDKAKDKAKVKDKAKDKARAKG